MRLRGSTVLVTGGVGVIGSHIVDQCLDYGCKVRILDSIETYVHPDGRPAWVPQEVELLVGDIRRPVDLRDALQGIDYVFHQAAFTGTPLEPARFFDVNSTGTAKLYETINKEEISPKKVVVASSQAVYGEGKYICQENGIKYPENRPTSQLLRGEWEVKCPECEAPMKLLLCDESTRLNGKTCYAVSKIAEERLSLTLGAEYSVPTTALRYGVVYGPRQAFSNIYAGVVSIFASRLANNLPPVVYEDGNQQRDWVCVEDIAQANIFAATHPKTDHGVFNVGTGKATTLLEIADLLAKIMGKQISPRVEGEFRPGDIRHLTLDTSRLESLGFKAATSLGEGLARYFDWLNSIGSVKEYYSRKEQVLREKGIVLTSRGEP